MVGPSRKQTTGHRLRRKRREDRVDGVAVVSLTAYEEGGGCGCGLAFVCPFALPSAHVCRTSPLEKTAGKVSFFDVPAEIPAAVARAIKIMSEVDLGPDVEPSWEP